MKLIDLTNEIFGRLTVLKIDPVPSSRIKWICRCSCGAVISASGHSLKNGDTRSCGCLASELTSNRNFVHGKSNTAEYGIWSAMKNRCFNSNTDNFISYGGRGITVCERWVNSFENFIADMGPRPTTEHTLERNDVNGDYSPDNCRWATYTEQARNKRNTAILTINGKEEKLMDLSDRTGLSRSTILSRINRGYTNEEAVSKSTELLSFTYNGVTNSLKEWSTILNIDYKILHNRIVGRGWSLEKAFTQPLRKRKN